MHAHPLSSPETPAETLPPFPRPLGPRVTRPSRANHQSRKRSVFSVIESIYRPTSGYRSAVTLVEMQEFMRAIGFPHRKLGGLEVRYTYDRAGGLIPHGRLARETFVVHQPHGSWSQMYNGPALDAMKKTLLDAGITYELITEYYEERGSGARPARGPGEGPA